MSKRRQPPDVRRAQILEAAVAVCAEKGYHATRIDDIAARAGISKGAVYHHFGSKQKVFIAGLDQMMDELVGALAAAEDASAGIADTVRRLLTLTAAMTADPSMAGAMYDVFLLGVRDGEFRDRIRFHYGQALASCTRLFRRGVDSGELRPTLDPDMAARSFLMSIDGIILDHLVLDDAAKMGSTITAFADHILDGLLQPVDRGEP